MFIITRKIHGSQAVRRGVRTVLRTVSCEPCEPPANPPRTGCEPPRTEQRPRLRTVVSRAYIIGAGRFAGAVRTISVRTRSYLEQGATGAENTCRISRAPAFSTRRGIGGLRPRPWPAQQPMVANERMSPKPGFAVLHPLPARISPKCQTPPGTRRPGNPANPCPARPKRLSPVCWPRPGAFIGLKPRRSRFFTNRKWRMTCREP
jgi:hypothetical protein